MLRSATLGLRLALRARPSRSALVVLGAALATALLLTTLGAYEQGLASQPPLSGDEQRLLLTIALAVACPIVVLLLTAARLSSSSRGARSAALSRLGLSRRRVRVVAGAENGALALVGAAIGVVLHVVVAAPGFAALAQGLNWFGGTSPRASVVMTVVTILAVVATAALAGYLPHRGARPGAAVSARTARPSWWRLAPLGAGVVALAGATISHGGSGDDVVSGEWTAFLGGGALAVLGLPLALPVAVRLIGDIASRSGSASVAIAGRGMQDEPAGTTRLVAVVLAAMVVVTGALCVLQAFWDTPQVQRQEVADTTGPQFGYVWVEPGQSSTQLVADLDAVPGVRASVPSSSMFLEGTPGDCDDLSATGVPCGYAFVGTCVDLAALVGAVEGCRDDEIAQIVIGQEQAVPSPWTLGAPTWLRENGYSGDTPPDPASVAVQLPPLVGEIRLSLQGVHENDSVEFSVFVPAAMAAAAGAEVPITSLRMVLDGGAAGRDPLAVEAARLGAYFEPESLEDLRAVEVYEAMVWGVGGIMLATGLAGLAIAGADRRAERRRRLASMWAIGTPLRVVRNSQLLRALLPLAIGAPLAVGVGGLVGAAYLALGGITGRFPWSGAISVLAVALLAAMLTSLVTVAGLGRRPKPELLRRE